MLLQRHEQVGDIFVFFFFLSSSERDSTTYAVELRLLSPVNCVSQDCALEKNSLTLSTLMCDNIAPHVPLFFAQRSKVV